MHSERNKADVGRTERGEDVLVAALGLGLGPKLLIPVNRAG